MRMTISETYPDYFSLLKLVSTFCRRRTKSKAPESDSIRITFAKNQMIKRYLRTSSTGRVNPNPKPIVILLTPRLTPTQFSVESIHTRVVVNHLLRIPVTNLNGPVDMIKAIRRHARVAIAIAAAPAQCLRELSTITNTNTAASVPAVLVTIFVVRARHGPVGALPEGLGAFDGFSGCCLALSIDVVEDLLVVILRAAVEVVELEAAIAA